MNIVDFFKKQVDIYNEDLKCGFCWTFSACSAGTWSPFGLLPCVITSPNIARMIEEEKPAELFEVMAYPNPFNHQFEITLQSTDSSNVSIKVYDMVGRMLDSRDVKSNKVSVQQLGDNYPTGVYNVIVSQSNNQRSFRIIKR